MGQLKFNLINEQKVKHHSYYIKNSQKWIQKRLNTGWIKFIDLEKNEYFNTITTKQDRLPNAGYIKVYVDYLDRDEVLYLLANDCAIITDEKRPFFARTITEEEAFLLMGFDLDDYKRAAETIEKLKRKK